MKAESNFSRAFIDLAKMGRTDWRSGALAILLVIFLGIPVNLTAAFLQIFFAHRLVHIPDAVKTTAFHVTVAIAFIFGLRLICRKILRRPFRSLISIDMTFDIRRCLLGAALCLPANAVSLVAFSLFFSIQVGAPLFRHFEWPHNDQIVASMGMLIVIPLLAFVEELFFRAWLTQTLGQYIRSTITVVALVAVVFAAFHTQYDLSGKMQVMVDSIGLSALSLRDRRLELAIGAHSMMNVCAMLQALFFSGALPHVQSPVTTLDLWSIVILRGVIPYALMYGLVQKTRAWFAPTDARLAMPDEILPGHPGN
jgi:membrane protease YdiL (CAAX protease family)